LVELLVGDALDASADALIVAAHVERVNPRIDRQSGESDEDLARRSDLSRREAVLGGLGAALLRRLHPDAREELVEQIPLVVPAGTAEVLQLPQGSGVAFGVVIAAGVISELGAEPRGLARRGLAAALREARADGCRTVVLNLPRIGWRLTPEDAARALADAVRSAPGLDRVSVYCPSEELASTARRMVFG
jgi:hypothetical protein